jgi:hypothetical protein
MFIATIHTIEFDWRIYQAVFEFKVLVIHL